MKAGLNTTSRYLDDILNINNGFFYNMVSQIYPSEPQMNTANTSDTETAFLDSLFIATPIVGVCNCSMFCDTLRYVHSSIAIILMGKRELVALLYLSSRSLVMYEWLFLAVTWGRLRFLIVVFADHTHLILLHLLISYDIVSTKRGSYMVWAINMGVCPRLEFDNIMCINCLGYDFYIYGAFEFLCNSIANL